MGAQPGLQSKIEILWMGRLGDCFKTKQNKTKVDDDRVVRLLELRGNSMCVCFTEEMSIWIKKQKNCEEIVDTGSVLKFSKFSPSDIYQKQGRYDKRNGKYVNLFDMVYISLKEWIDYYWLAYIFLPRHPTMLCRWICILVCSRRLLLKERCGWMGCLN